MLKCVRLVYLSFMVSLGFTGIGKSDDAPHTTDSTKVVGSSPVFTIEATEEELIYDRVLKLFAEENGIKYLIELDDKELWNVTHFYKTITAVIDLDGDGIAEVLLETQSSGNCCGPTFHVIKRIDESFYDILSHEEFAAVDPTPDSSSLIPFHL